MPYAKGYVGAQGKFNGRDFIKPPIITLGNLSIKDIDPEVIEKYKIAVGQVTPFTSLRITE